MRSFIDTYKASTPLFALQHEGRVVLHITGGVAFVKKAYPEPLLVLQTTESLEMGEGGLLVTLVGYGSKLLDLNDLKRTPLIMMGLTAKAAELLIDELNTQIDK